MLNQVTVQGRIPKSESFKYFFKEGEEESHNFWSGYVSVPRDYKPEGKEYPEEDLIECIAFGKTATIINKFFKPGSNILCSGRLFTTKKTETKDGQTIWPKTQIQIERVMFQYGNPKDSEDSSTDTVSSAPTKKKITFGHKKSPF